MPRPKSQQRRAIANAVSIRSQCEVPARTYLLRDNPTEASWDNGPRGVKLPRRCLNGFPEANKDELSYSLLGRYGRRVLYPMAGLLMRNLFGTTRSTADVELPTRLGSLIAAMPPGHGWTIDSFIYEHTFFPYYAPFLQVDRRSRLFADMQGAGGAGIFRRAGLSAARVHMPQRFRYCPLCAKEERQAQGECFWHRLHQAPGVLVCTNHKVWLVESGVQLRNRDSKQRFVPALVGAKLAEPQVVSQSDHRVQRLLRVAEDTEWLLTAAQLTRPETHDLRQHYRETLHRLGGASYRGRLSGSWKVVSMFYDFYGPDLLGTFGCSLSPASSNNWLVRLLRPSEDRVQAPLHHLLLIQFLGFSARDFLTAAADLAPSTPFQSAPWPCLNPAGGHTGELTVPAYGLHHSDQQVCRSARLLARYVALRTRVPARTRQLRTACVRTR